MPQLKWTTHADLAIRRNPTVGREEYLDHMTFRRNERPLFTEIFGPIVGLKEEWLAQSATPEELDFSAFAYRCESRAMVPVNTGRCGGRPIEEIEDTDEHRIWRDELGRTMKLPKGVATLPLPLDYPVKTMDDWLAIKPLYEFGEERFTPGWQDTSREHLANDRVLCVAIPGGFDEPRQLMGDAGLCIAYYEQPELVRDILDTIGDMAVRVLDRVSWQVQADMLCVHEDMAGKSGPLAGPAQVREFIAASRMPAEPRRGTGTHGPCDSKPLAPRGDRGAFRDGTTAKRQLRDLWRFNRPGAAPEGDSPPYRRRLAHMCAKRSGPGWGQATRLSSVGAKGDCRNTAPRSDGASSRAPVPANHRLTVSPSHPQRGQSTRCGGKLRRLRLGQFPRARRAAAGRR